jgi:hypothetical protein
MLSSRRRDYQRLARDDIDPPDIRDDAEPNSFETFEIEDTDPLLRAHPRWRAFLSFLCGLCCPFTRAGRRSRRRGLYRRCAVILLAILALLIVATPIFNPSYSERPHHYTGTNPRNESVYIAANIIDEDLIRGAWGNALVELVDRLSPSNVFVSIYENDSGDRVKQALADLARRLKCRFASCKVTWF